MMSGGRAKRRKQQAWRNAYKNRVLTRLARPCMNNCGAAGPHFVPPSLGEPGFFTCTPKATEDNRE